MAYPDDEMQNQFEASEALMIECEGDWVKFCEKNAFGICEEIAKFYFVAGWKAAVIKPYHQSEPFNPPLGA